MTDDNQYSHKERRHFVRQDDAHLHETVSIEKRKYVRLGFKDKFSYTICNRGVKQATAESLDISQYGIHFTSDVEPKKNAIISMKLKPGSLKACLSAEQLLHENNGEILGKIIRVTQNKETGIFEIAAAFLKKGI